MGHLGLGAKLVLTGKLRSCLQFGSALTGCYFTHCSLNLMGFLIFAIFKISLCFEKYLNLNLIKSGGKNKIGAFFSSFDRFSSFFAYI